jgi:hypothetical protein
MAFVVEMIGKPDAVGRRFFCCSATNWRQVLQLGLDWGWQPAGTSSDNAWKNDWEQYGRFSADYECDEWGKSVSAADATALAEALERASRQPLPKFERGPTLLREDVTADEARMANANLDAGSLGELIRFLRRGEFTFLWDD